MKTTITSLLILVSLFTFGQKPLIIERVVQVDSVSKDELFDRAKLWVASTYNSSRNVMQIENKESGHIMGKALIRYNSNIFMGSGATQGIIDYTFNIYFKDGRYKYGFSDFYHDANGISDFGLITTDDDYPRSTSKAAQKWENKVWQDIKSQIGDEMLLILSNLEVIMNHPIETQKNDW